MEIDGVKSTHRTKDTQVRRIPDNAECFPCTTGKGHQDFVVDATENCPQTSKPFSDDDVDTVKEELQESAQCVPSRQYHLLHGIAKIKVHMAKHAIRNYHVLSEKVTIRRSQDNIQNCQTYQQQRP
mmetsp:Transcript_20429/g.44661  ORF Transcript_20429/g.44661 Transcript_20429/m.44661 type:complete len:126 (+) Transcript_20429:686-1063(+)